MFNMTLNLSKSLCHIIMPQSIFFQVLNALGKVAKKDIWVQEPDSKVDWLLHLYRQTIAHKNCIDLLSASAFIIDATVLGIETHTITDRLSSRYARISVNDLCSFI